MSIWTSATRTLATTWVYREIPTTPADVDWIQPNSGYVSIYLRSLRLVGLRKGLIKFYGVVNSTIQIPRLSRSGAEFTTVVAPDVLRDQPANDFRNLIQLNRCLLGGVPYRGGRVEAEVGLIAVPSTALLDAYLDLLVGVSEAAGVAFSQPALTLASPLRRGIAAIFDQSSDPSLEIGFSNTWQQLRACKVIIVKCPRSQGSTSYSLSDDGSYALLDAAGRLVEQYSYMVLEITHSPRREDWFTIPALFNKYEELRYRYQTRDTDQRLEDALEDFRRAALTSDDLLPSDAQEIAREVESLYRSFGPPSRTIHGYGAGAHLPDLSTLDPFRGKQH